MKHGLLIFMILLCSLAKGQIPEGFIIKTDGDRIYINLHRPAIKLSDVLTVYANDGNGTTVVAQIEITDISGSYSTGKVLSGASAPLAEKMIVRKDGNPPPVAVPAPIPAETESTPAPEPPPAPTENQDQLLNESASMPINLDETPDYSADNEPSWNTPPISERKIEYHDGVPYQYYVNNGLTVSQTNTKNNDYGKWFRVDIVVQNNTMVPIDFDPATSITAYSVDKKEKQTYLDVWAYDRYMKKVHNAQVWNAVAVGLAGGLAAMNAGFSTSTTTTTTNTHFNGVRNNHGNAPVRSGGNYVHNPGTVHTITRTTRTYDAAAAYQASAIAQNNMAALSDSQWNINNAIQMGYLKRNTIYSGQSVAGYVLIERKSGKVVNIIVTINDANYEFAWNY